MSMGILGVEASCPPLLVGKTSAFMTFPKLQDFPVGTSGKEPTC